MYEKYLEPPDVWAGDCCEDDDCIEECNCANHICIECGLLHNCRCDFDYDNWEDFRMDFDE